MLDVDDIEHWSMGSTQDLSRVTDADNTGTKTTQKEADDEPKAPSSGLSAYLKKCERLYEEEMKKAEEKLFQQITHCFDEDKQAETHTNAELVKQCGFAELTIQDLRAKLNDAEEQKQSKKRMIEQLTKKSEIDELTIQNLYTKLREAELNIVGSIRISPSNPMIFTRQKSEINIDLTNQTDSLICWKVYVSSELLGCISFMPNDGIIEPQKVGVVNAIWSLKKPATSKWPLSFTFKWTTVPAGNKSAKKIDDSWLVDRPIRQKIIMVQMISD